MTKKGDCGFTYVLGKRLPKDSPIIEALGTLDELCAFLSFARSTLKDRRVKKTLREIQEEISICAAETASIFGDFSPKKKISKNNIERLEREINALEKRLNLKKGFVFGESFVSSSLEVARAVVRRAERRCASLRRKKRLSNKNIIAYLNRLSDFLYLLARKYDR